MKSPVGEFDRIARLAGILGDVGPEAAGEAAIGDDAAIVTDGRGDRWVWTVDALVEGVHFRFDWLDPEAVGHRALAASLSDLAAMAAEPVGALVTAAGPTATISERLEGIYSGLSALARESGCPILGGDLARAEGPLHLTVGALGRPIGDPWTRAGAGPGDEVWVTGGLGGPAAAVALFEEQGADPVVREHPAYERFARPAPRVGEALWLAERTEIHAAIDISDGLSGDARHLSEASGVRIEIEPGEVPLHPGAVLASEALDREPRAWALHGGEEFELLLCAPPGELEPLADPFRDRWGVGLTRIGQVDEGEGVWRVDTREIEPLEPLSWDHFSGPLASGEGAR